jgi:unsaturated rhamnogalacturonyl hydrolase
MKIRIANYFLILLFCVPGFVSGQIGLPAKEVVLQQLHLANQYWQKNNAPERRAFWDHAAYHTGNMAAFELTKIPEYRAYSEAWATHNEWKGAKSDNREEWKYHYGERDDFVLFGDWQICFQTYIDLYHLDPQPHKIARAIEVMEYQMSTTQEDYWWWADGLYMVMPVMTKLYHETGKEIYLDKLHTYFSYARKLMYDEESHLFYRDAKYIYPQHKTASGKKDFWARGDGWVFAGLAKVIEDLPKDHIHRAEYISVFKEMAEAILQAQQPEGYWTRSMIDKDQAPGPETSGTAFFSYGLWWGMKEGLLDPKVYQPAAIKAWEYLTQVALQKDGRLGYVQPIGERAIPGQQIDAQSTADFGVGAFLLASTALIEYLDADKK